MKSINLQAARPEPRESYSRIEEIARRMADANSRPYFRFTVLVANSTGTQTLGVTLDAHELTSYAAFQRAILTKTGFLFRCEDYEAKRGQGESAWRDEVEWHLSRATDAPEASA